MPSRTPAEYDPESLLPPPCAADYADSRLIWGMHYRRDIAAGEALGAAVAEALLHNARFRIEYDAAERELKAAHLVE